jgi:hypothetical protein
VQIDPARDSAQPGDLQEVNCNGRRGIGLLWAKQNESLVASFALTAAWSVPRLAAQFREMGENGEITGTDIEIANLSNTSDVGTHSALIRDYGRSISASSLVHEGDGFAVRMFFNDHNPPHFHVMVSRESPETIARYDMRTLDILSGTPRAVLRERIESWAITVQEQLLHNWQRCRTGQHPVVLD